MLRGLMLESKEYEHQNRKRKRKAVNIGVECDLTPDSAVGDQILAVSFFIDLCALNNMLADEKNKKERS